MTSALIRRTIYLEVCNGLCNRLNALISGICLAQDLMAYLVIYWPSSHPKCTAAFFDLFQENCIPKWVKIVDGNAPQNKIMCVTQKEALEAVTAGKAIMSWAEFHQTDSKRWRGHLKNLIPIQLIINEVQKNFSAIPVSHVPVGIHIRRTDNRNSISESPIEGFQAAMNNIANGFFYVASDDLNVVLTLKKRFSNKVYCHETLRNRNTVAGIREAVVSLYTLSLCSFVIGSYGSSFSRIAAQLGSKECKIIRSLNNLRK